MASELLHDLNSSNDTLASHLHTVQEMEVETVELINNYALLQENKKYEIENAKTQIIECFDYIIDSFRAKQSQLINELDILLVEQHNDNLFTISSITTLINDQKRHLNQQLQSSSYDFNAYKQLYANHMDSIRQSMSAMSISICVDIDQNRLSQICGTLKKIITVDRCGYADESYNSYSLDETTDENILQNVTKFNDAVAAAAMGNVISDTDGETQYPEKDEYGYQVPKLQDKSKYKVAALEYCQKMGWARPTESAQFVEDKFEGTVSFGEPGKEHSASGEGSKQKNAMYDAYMKLVPLVIPKQNYINLIAKWSITQHPKTAFLRWSQEKGVVVPKPQFVMDATLRSWSCRLKWRGKII
eukprot:341791_1